MKMRQILTGALGAAAGAMAHPTQIPEITPRQHWEQIDAKSFVAFEAGIPREKIHPHLRFRWLSKEHSPTLPTLIVASTRHGSTLGYTNETGSRLLTEEHSAFVSMVRDLYSRKAIQCVYMEALTTDFADELNKEGIAKIKRLRTARKKWSDEALKDFTEHERFRGVFTLTTINAIKHFEKIIEIMDDMKLNDFHYHAIYPPEVIRTMLKILDSIRFSALFDLPENAAKELRLGAKQFESIIRGIVDTRGLPNPYVLGVPFYLSLVHNIPITLCGTANKEIQDKILQIKEEITRAKMMPTGLEEDIKKAEMQAEQARKDFSQIDVNASIEDRLKQFLDKERAERPLTELKVRDQAIREARGKVILDREEDFIGRARETVTLETIMRDHAQHPTDVKVMFYGHWHGKNWGERSRSVLGADTLNVLEAKHVDTKD